MRKVMLILCSVLVCSSVAFAQGKWRKFHGPEIGPGPRSGHGMVVDEARQKIVLFGGDYYPDNVEWEDRFLNDTWEFDLKPLFRNISPGNQFEHGNTARFTVRIHNLGLDESQGHKVSLFLSTDEKLSDDDKLLIAKKFTRHIKQNTKTDLTLSKRISKNIAPGQYYVIVKVQTDKGMDLNMENNITVRKKAIMISD